MIRTFCLLALVSLISCEQSKQNSNNSANNNANSTTNNTSNTSKTDPKEYKPRNDLALTEENIKGPFFRKDAPFRNKLVKDDTPGKKLYISGTLTDIKGTPIADAEIDIWHADDSGEYDNETEEFLCRGKIKTDKDGKYFYDTVYPARYLLSKGYSPEDDKERPSHIHYMVSANGYKKLTTQLYFKDDPWNGRDPFIRKSLIIELKETDKDKLKKLEGVFDIVLEKK